MRLTNVFALFVLVIVGIIWASGCESSSAEARRYREACGGCHMLPDPASLPKSVWREGILPEMAARMGFRYDGYDPFSAAMDEEFLEMQSGVYPDEPTIDSATWWAVHDYIIALAPDSIAVDPLRSQRNETLTQFVPSLLKLDSGGTVGVTSLTFDKLRGQLLIGDATGRLFSYGEALEGVGQQSSPVVAVQQMGASRLLTTIGRMQPSQIADGALQLVTDGASEMLADRLHRPVFTKQVDLDQDGQDEILVCEFGYLTGSLTLLQRAEGKFERRRLLPLPGAIKFELADMNEDGRLDIVALFSQGKEGIYIFYQREDLRFDVSHALELPPEFGSSWFDLQDMNDDGQPDIILANGDNADYSPVLKDYHGIRIYLNDGSNHFQKSFFYPIYGATRTETQDFDGDGDLDIAVLAYFPERQFGAAEGFVYLERTDAAALKFQPYTHSLAAAGRWLTMEAGDFDRDGDVDLMLGNYPLTAGDKALSPGGEELLFLTNQTQSLPDQPDRY